MKRKTIDVSRIKDMVNLMLKNSTDEKTQGREALSFLLESVLMQTGNYRGFGYLGPKDMEASTNGCSYGINATLGPEKQFENTDHTRVFYY